MKKIRFLILFIFSIFCTSCTGFKLSYLNEDLKWFEEIDGEILGSNNSLLIHGNKNHRWFELIFNIGNYDNITKSVRINHLAFLDTKGDTIPYTLSYRTFPNRIDTFFVETRDESMSVLFGDNDRPSVFLYIYAKCEKRARSIRVKYNIEINGEQISGDCWYKKRIVINSRPGLPGQPWII